MGKKKILFVMSSLYNGGAEKSLVNLLCEMDYSRYDVDLLLFKPQGLFMNQIPKEVNVLKRPKHLENLYNDGISYNMGGLIKIVGTMFSKIIDKRYNYQKGFRWKWFYKNYLESLSGHYDIAFAGINGDIAYYVGDKVKADKKICMVHNDYKSSEFPKKYDYKYFKEFDTIGSISESCVEILKEYFPEFSGKIKILRNITSSKLIRNRAEEFYPKEYTYTDKLIILSVGRLSTEKGFDLAIQAANILKEKEYAFIWYIIGSGVEENNLREMIKKYHVEEYIKLLGIRENPYPYIKNCNIFVQPSRFEGKSVVLDEAKILAKPILATNYPTVRDQLTDKDGIIVNLTARDIAEGILNLTETEQKKYSDYLSTREYGNQDEIEKYYKIFE